MLTVAEAVACCRSFAPLPGRTELPLTAAVGRILASPLHLQTDQPPFDRATMDGYAVGLPGGPSFRVLGSIFAGQESSLRVGPGEAVRITTGASTPADTTVVPVEATTGEQDGVVQVPGPIRPRANIAWRGEDGRAGAEILAAGTRLTPATIALAAHAGHHRVPVFPQPRLALMTTGDEVGREGPAGIADSNGPYLAAFAADQGLPAHLQHAPDDGVALRAALAQALDQADVIITAGGVGPGEKDLIPRLATTFGFTPRFHHVAMQPGKPVYLATRSDGRILMGLPGNPVSVLATSLILLDPLLRAVQGRPPRGVARAKALAPLTGKARHLFLPGILTAEGVTPLPWNGSGDLIAATAGNALISIPPGFSAAVGTEVEVIPYLGGDAHDRGKISR